ncbi:tRNA pseudouridine(38-40) synthase TruA [Natronosalvus rutilus]|uniref:tRNA pseudouridine synthase A n=1 Tax=Natronosalvus rutilus TaxID=2953753 RepID=A0A9E7NBX8_9EURY|nr:tRNA pseudouridine(38-40) synthase TruA [Natronosalvus rutilus]UTF54154.1 tRNA pseudouridine(38-40) synthase TruA [Natronosalvus rutilus]
MRAYRIAYDGTSYYGFQRQPDVPTVEDAIFDAVRELEVLGDDPKPAGYAAAGRTDAGVSALAQTVAFEAPGWLTPRALNSALPGDVRAWASADASADFHATHHATRRVYTYHLYAPRAGSGTGSGLDAPAETVETTESVDDNRFHAALEALSGPHDFHNLTPDEEGTRRSPTLEAQRDGPFLEITVSAPGFARELVRRLVSLARAVGSGEEPLEKIDRALDSEPLPGHEGIAPAAPESLVLSRVDYSNTTLEFAVDAEAAQRSREILEGRRIDQLVGARVARQLRDGLEMGVSGASGESSALGESGASGRSEESSSSGDSSQTGPSTQ